MTDSISYHRRQEARDSADSKTCSTSPARRRRRPDAGRDSRDLDSAVRRAAKAFPTWGKTSTSRTRRRLPPHRQGDRRPCRGTGDAADPGTGQAAERARLALRNRRRPGLDRLYRRDRPAGRRHRRRGEAVELHRKPIGVVGSITPWNWPVMIACWHIIPAIRVGNTVVIKPSPIHAPEHDPAGRDHERSPAARRGQRGERRQ